jgi:hypothetical protein
MDNSCLAVIIAWFVDLDLLYDGAASCCLMDTYASTM